MSEKSPTMTYPPVNHLHFDDMTDYGNDILLRQAADIPQLDNHTKSYLQEISTIRRSLHDQAQPISLEE